MLVIFKEAAASAGSAKAKNATTPHHTFVIYVSYSSERAARLIGQAEEQQSDADGVYKTVREHRNPQIAPAEQVGRADHEPVAGGGEHAGRTLVVMAEAEQDRDID